MQLCAQKLHEAEWVMVVNFKVHVLGKGRQTYTYKDAYPAIINGCEFPQLLEFDVELKEFQELKELPVDFQPRYMYAIFTIAIHSIRTFTELIHV